MSILTGQADKLRKAALIQEEHVYDVKLQLTNAIDTILSLRYRARELRAENAKLRAENAKLRELVQLLLYGIDHDIEPAERLAWSHEVKVLMKELGIEVEE